MSKTKLVVAFLAVLFWPVSLVSFQVYLLFFRRLCGTRDWYGLLIFDLFAVMIGFVEYQLYLREESTAFWCLYLFWGIVAYLMMLVIKNLGTISRSA